MTFMKIDSHHHFWKYKAIEYGWIDEPMKILQQNYLPQDLKLVLESEGFDGCIAVQARQSLEETRWLLQLADENPWILGVVGWVDLCAPDIDKQLINLSQNKKLVGVRHIIHDEPDDRFMLRDDFRHGIGCLAKHGLTYDLLLFPKHLKNAVMLVAEFPDQPFVIDHISKPLIRQGILEPWETDLRLLAKYPNVNCKLSGMVTEAVWNNWDQKTFKPYLDVVFEAFGPDRLMIGSDWPVCLLGGPYSKVIAIVKKYIEKLDTATQNKILGENCCQFYKLHQNLRQ
jgi:L-fuconolactonase